MNLSNTYLIYGNAVQTQALATESDIISLQEEIKKIALEQFCHLYPSSPEEALKLQNFLLELFIKFQIEFPEVLEGNEAKFISFVNKAMVHKELSTKLFGLWANVSAIFNGEVMQDYIANCTEKPEVYCFVSFPATVAEMKSNPEYKLEKALEIAAETPLFVKINCGRILSFIESCTGDEEWGALLFRNFYDLYGVLSSKEMEGFLRSTATMSEIKQFVITGFSFLAKNCLKTRWGDEESAFILKTLPKHIEQYPELKGEMKNLYEDGVQNAKNHSNWVSSAVYKGIREIYGF